MANVRFVEGDIHDPAPGGPFDALTTRVVLTHNPDPSDILRVQARVLRADGLVVAMEIDAERFWVVPPTALSDQVIRWIIEGLSRGGVPLSFGSGLWSLMEEAGLKPKGMIGIQPCFGPEDPDSAAALAGIVPTMIPIIERTGVTTAEEIDITSLEQRLSDDLASARASSSIHSCSVLGRRSMAIPFSNLTPASLGDADVADLTNILLRMVETWNQG